MKKLFLVLFAISFSFILTNVFAQSLDEILNKYYETVGQEKLLEKNSVVIKGKIMQGGMEIPFAAYQKRPNMFRSEGTFQGMTVVQVYSGDEGWTLNPFMGMTEPQPMTEDELDRMKMQADFDGPLYNYKDKGYEVELLGTEEVDGIEAYKIKLTRSNGDEIIFFIDSENYVPLKTLSTVKVQNVDTEVETIFSNYKDAEGILTPYEVETKVNGQTQMQMVFESVNYEEEVPDSLFAKPEVEKSEEPESEMENEQE